MNYTKLPKKVLLLLATPVLFSLTVPAGKLVAQSQTETKIRLMAEGLRARDSGDLVTAKTNFEQLLVLAPNDVTVQRLLSGVNESLAQPAAPAVEVAAPVSEPKEVVYAPSAAPAVSADSTPVKEVVYDPNAAATPAAEPDSPATALAKAEEARVQQLLADADAEAKAAARLAKDGDFETAAAKYEAAARSLPTNTLTEEKIEELNSAKNELLLRKSQALLKQGDTAGAQAALDAYVTATSPESKAARRQAAKIDEAELNPSLQPIDKINPNYLEEQKKLAALLAKGRSQYVAGDIDGAQETFRVVETIASENAEAKYFLKRIADEKAKLGTLNREKTRSLMIEEVAKSWQRPGRFVEPGARPDGPNDPSSKAMADKLGAIIIPSVSFTGVELGRVVSTLAALSTEYDTNPVEAERGVNLVLGSQLAGTAVPQVNITLRNMSLKRILDIITENHGYQIEIQPDLVLIKPSGTDVNLVNEEFPVTKSAVTRMTGVGSGGSSTPSAASADPFAPAAPAATGPSGGGESDAIRRFLQAAGVPFDSVPNASIAYDGSRILVTQTSRNIDRIRNILARYNDIRQVEIEAKFMDVAEGALDELGVAWNASGRGSPLFDTVTGQPVLGSDGNQTTGNYKTTLGTVNRSLVSAFTGSSSANGGSITSGGTTIPINNSSPNLPGTVNLGGAAGSLAAVSGVVGDFDVSATLRALSQRTGSDLLSAPKITVLSGNRASITVAQELRFPNSYGEIQSEVGTASGTTTGGAAGVTITAGTPQDFTSRNVGVELAVTPTVEEDDYSISLELNPRVTEFEGFVEYGGSSIAISGSTTVTVPSGFFQPIFSTREINTRVTVWDGATLVMGGLTREEVKRVNDKVPILGDIPYLGRAFKSKGESSQKRNLLIFVTANLVSPGGSLKKQDLRGVPSSSTFQNPSMVTPSGSESRTRNN